MHLNLTIPFSKFSSTFCLLLFSVFILNAQNNPSKDSLISSYNTYTKAPRELAYVHLNKSVFVKGEVVGFNAYVLDKNSKQLSTVSTNLYCTISDKNKTVIKSKLIKITGGTAKGEFYVDSLFTSGEYTFKAYTNWMRNFEEQNFYSQTIKVIDLEKETTITSKTISNLVDAQFLPEGGHLVAETENTIGVVIKDSLGFGVATEGVLIDKDSTVLTSFKTNEFGIGKFLFTPTNNSTYSASIDVNKNTQVFKMPIAESKGINLSLSDLGTKVALTFKTNSSTLDVIKNRVYTLTFHDGKNIKLVDFNFNETTEIIKLINYSDLSSGINVFTLFDDQNNPILERLFFKYDGISFIESDTYTVKKDMDSLKIQLSIKDIDTSKINRFSISVLPEETKSYNHHHNITSFAFLQPYVKGYVENAKYYFTEINRKKKYELDNLLLTQGWSSYDWHTIFNYPPNLLYDFEIGININANINSKNSGQFLIYPTKYSDSNIIVLSENENAFERSEIFFFNDETLKIGEITSQGKVETPSLYIQFTPSTIPDLKFENKILNLKSDTFLEFSESSLTFKPSWEKVQELDEVVVTTQKKGTRLQKLKGNSPGNVTIFDENKREQYFDFAAFIQTQGYQVVQHEGQLYILPKLSKSILLPKTAPRIYLDDRLISDLNFFYNYRLDNVDYIIVDKSGFGGGVTGSSGIIKIYTDPSIGAFRQYGKAYKEFKIPLTFSTSKKFYSPIYSTFNNDFFKEYGVIDWFPDLEIDKNGLLNFSIYNTKATAVKLFIEGVANDGSFISEEKTITIN